MSTEQNKALVRRFVEASNQGNLDALDELIADNFVITHHMLRGERLVLRASNNSLE